MNTTIEEKYIATMLLHALGDTIGFKNGSWEFFDDTGARNGATLEKVYEFIELGGINDINLEHWSVSDDTIMHMAIARSLILGDNNIDDLERITTEQIIRSVRQMSKEKTNGVNRYVGKSVEKYAKLMENGENWKTFAFDPLGGGNGSAMRCNCIGLAFFGDENRDKLIKYAVESSKMTHPNPIGWLGGLSVALFTAFGIEGIPINDWIPIMLKIIESNDVKKYIDTTQNNLNNIINAFECFVGCWKTYYDSKFLNGVPVKTRIQKNIPQRLVFYNNISENNDLGKMGLSGYSAVIVAYDCLIDAGNKWETFVFYAMINDFDSDTIGAIAGGLYGTLYGMNSVPKNNLEHIEYKDTLIKMGKLLYKKYFLHEQLVMKTKR